MPSLLSCDKGSFSLVDGIPKEGIYKNWVSFGESVIRQISRVQRTCFPAFAVFQVSQLKRVSIRKCRALVWHVLNSYSRRSGWHILLSFVTIKSVNIHHIETFPPAPFLLLSLFLCVW